jgi:hypothetical protein
MHENNGLKRVSCIHFHATRIRNARLCPSEGRPTAGEMAGHFAWRGAAMRRALFPNPSLTITVHEEIGEDWRNPSAFLSPIFALKRPRTVHFGVFPGALANGSQGMPMGQPPATPGKS